MNNTATTATTSSEREIQFTTQLFPCNGKGDILVEQSRSWEGSSRPGSQVIGHLDQGGQFIHYLAHKGTPITF